MNHIYSIYALMATIVFIITFLIIWLKKYSLLSGIKYIMGAIISFIIGARILHYLFNPLQYNQANYSLFDFELHGFSLYGGIILSLIYSIIYSKLKKINFWDLSDKICISFAISFIPMRLGCFFNGCCFGRPFNGLWAIKYGLFSFSHKIQIRKYNAIFPLSIHPTQIYEIIIVIIALAFGIYMSKKKKQSGILAIYFSLVFTVGRFINLYFREELPYSNYHIYMKYIYIIVIISILFIIYFLKMFKINKK